MGLRPALGEPGWDIFKAGGLFCLGLVSVVHRGHSFELNVCVLSGLNVMLFFIPVSVRSFGLCPLDLTGITVDAQHHGGENS